MSTEDQSAPRTRAEARAAREAEAAAAEAGAAAGGEHAVETPAVPEIPIAEPIEAAAVPPVAAPSAAEPAGLTLRQAQGSEQQSAAPSHRRFRYTLFAVVGILAVIVAGLSAVSLSQGPRVTDVQVDPSEAIETSGSRVVLTANQALQEIDETQITVTPAVPFTVDAAGRSIGIRFTVPLDDATEYAVRVSDVTGTGGGPASDLTESFTTPASEIFLLNRTDEGDSIFRADLAGDGVPVFTHPRISDYRATPTSLVVAVDDDDESRILVMDHAGKNIRELTLPGNGYVRSVQVSDRGGLVGYSYSDREISEESGRASVLAIQSLSGDGEPQIVTVGDKEAGIGEWQFVPDSAAVLFIDFDGVLSLDDRSGDAGAQNMGIAASLLGISRGTYTAVIQKVDGSIVELNLADGSETPFAASDPDYGEAATISPFPGGTLRHVVARDETGLPTGQMIVRVDDEGAAEPLLDVASGSAILQACASPSGQYAAVTVAPNLTENAYDLLPLPLPKVLQTHLMDLRSGEELVVLTGFDVSWCEMAPAF